MAEMKMEDVFKIDVMSVTGFAKKYGGGVTSQALYYAMDNKKIDFIRIGNDRLIVMTSKTKQYKPNANKNREELPPRTALMQTSI